MSQLARRYKLGKTTIYDILHRHGVDMRRPGAYVKYSVDESRVKEMLAEGCSIKHISNELEVTASVIRRIATRLDPNYKPRHPKRYTNEELLSALKPLVVEHGTRLPLYHPAVQDLPVSHSTYCRRFKTWMEAKKAALES